MANMVTDRDCPHIEIDAMRRPHGIADWSRDLRDQSECNDDRLPHENFRLLVQEARAKARQFLNESSARGYTTIIENWRQLSDGQIEFTIRRLPTASG